MKNHHHHHHIVLAARISLTLFRHSSLSFIALGRSSGQQPVSSHSCWMYVRAGRPAFARPCVGVHKSTSLMSSSLLLIMFMYKKALNILVKPTKEKIFSFIFPILSSKFSKKYFFYELSKAKSTIYDEQSTRWSNSFKQEINSDKKVD